MMADEELGDEVKVFRRDEDADDDPMISGETSEQQLADDKKEAVMEAELDGAGRNPSIDVLKSAFPKVEPMSPSFPGLMSHFSPGYSAAALPMFMPLFMNPYAAALRSPSLMFPMGAMSPTFPMFPPSPVYGAAIAAAAAKQHFENMAPLNMRAGHPMNQMGMPPYMHPSSMAPQNVDRRAQGGGKAKKDDHVKKPLNAFMWFMKENRKALLEEIGNNEKQSAELNKELGKRWHDLSKEEQAKYFEMAKKDKETHKERYPEWSARENYAVNKKKTKKRRDKSIPSENNDQKKCRARFGVNNTEMWCKFCKRKKKCEYATDRSGGSDITDSQDGRGTSGAYSSSSESPSPKANAGIALTTQQQQAAMMHTMLMQMRLGSTTGASTHVPSPLASSSAGRSPLDANASDSESDVEEEEDEQIDPTVMQQTHDMLMQESMCTI
ncbi:Protein pop-1 [Caenorhabditis elegans]|uniref:Protein pop-1 n=1 Tax=Caenorhabditis elegans TaxID=6239 RepID=POP1_CAEEL|nr:Protein pop-1 [Caenorhabditis elegans]Q10666.3 RecName: Full=Protein pop-1; AltName: Full=Posterior pharynx defect protein 1; AltName: Full=TCF transcription factor pop-1 [Caenorhabditis elegans]CCD73394.2 Protein pop-1 [Caenorhabditis elegans]|eukprot:NP_491053.4 Protein pop-1 [Caenorhabditis elegans]